MTIKFAGKSHTTSNIKEGNIDIVDGIEIKLVFTDNWKMDSSSSPFLSLIFNNDNQKLYDLYIYVLASDPMTQNNATLMCDLYISKE